MFDIDGTLTETMEVDGESRIFQRRVCFWRAWMSFRKRS